MQVVQPVPMVKKKLNERYLKLLKVVNLKLFPFQTVEIWKSAPLLLRMNPLNP